MTRKVLFALVAVVGISLLIWGGRRYAANRDVADLEEQLRLAREEGIPTNGREFAAIIPTAKLEENAAPFYSKLSKLSPDHTQVSQLYLNLAVDDGPKNLTSAQSLLGISKAYLAEVDHATAKPRCWFDRNWDADPFGLEETYGEMRTAAQMLAIRSMAEAAHGDDLSSLKDVRSIFKISDHAGETPGGSPQRLQLSVYSIGLHCLATLAFRHVASNDYRELLRTAVSNLHPKDLWKSHLDDLAQLQWVIEKSSSAKGLEDLGVKDGETSVAPTKDVILSSLLSKPKAHVAAVRDMRSYIAASRLPSPQRESQQKEAFGKLGVALAAFPVVAGLYDEFYDLRDDGRAKQFEASKQTYIALLRALDGGSVHRSIETKDLKSPFDGKPLSYRFNDDQIQIEVSGLGPNGRQVKLHVPPELPASY